MSNAVNRVSVRDYVPEKMSISSWLEKSGWGERLFCGRVTFSIIKEIENRQIDSFLYLLLGGV